MHVISILCSEKYFFFNDDNHILNFFTKDFENLMSSSFFKSENLLLSILSSWACGCIIPLIQEVSFRLTSIFSRFLRTLESHTCYEDFFILFPSLFTVIFFINSLLHFLLIFYIDLLSSCSERSSVLESPEWEDLLLLEVTAKLCLFGVRNAIL